MSAMTLEQDLTVGRTSTRTPEPARPLPGRARPSRPARGTGPATAPLSRPGRSVPAPTLRRASARKVTSCTVTAPAPSGAWRLTDRGIAAVLVVLAVIAVTGVMVVGLTALKVTSPTYQAYGQSQLSQP